MLSQDFASALGQIRNELAGLVKENQLLHKRIDDLTKQVEQSDERIFKQQSKRIRQAAAANDFDSLEALNSGAISPVDAELIRLAMPVETIQPIAAATPNNALVLNMITAAREGRFAPPLQQRSVPDTRNIERVHLQLKANAAAMAQQAQIQRDNQQRLDAIKQAEYKKQNNALVQRSPLWGMDSDGKIIDY
ncbi:hypothetical protein [Synechococcus sp. WH 8016]|uniref:hypothetical protein n=1 Tax=Synechococcus sp. WH 8016 TaxID=166318 RepID=UPI00022D7D69|nr:hypothetical protein [Synechococcus sp. WH 8016]EHA63757.1 hypothetical protein Syn8016DRAFT_0798 [Synechococcus sp. WH 8016]